MVRHAPTSACPTYKRTNRTSDHLYELSMLIFDIFILLNHYINTYHLRQLILLCAVAWPQMRVSLELAIICGPSHAIRHK